MVAVTVLAKWPQKPMRRDTMEHHGKAEFNGKMFPLGFLAHWISYPTELVPRGNGRPSVPLRSAFLWNSCPMGKVV